MSVNRADVSGLVPYAAHVMGEMPGMLNLMPARVIDSGPATIGFPGSVMSARLILGPTLSIGLLLPVWMGGEYRGGSPPCPTVSSIDKWVFRAGAHFCCPSREMCSMLALIAHVYWILTCRIIYKCSKYYIRIYTVLQRV